MTYLNQDNLDLTNRATARANAEGIDCGYRLNAFQQGYRHATAGRTDLWGTGFDATSIAYDLGYAAGLEDKE